MEDNNLHIWGCPRRKADGTYPDVAPGPGGAMQEQHGIKFPAYSPDINGPIEKCWRECQRRVLARATEINGLADHRRIIEEEWAGLEFDWTEHWCGINHLVLCMEDILEEVVEEDGYDTSYMHH